MEQNSRNSMEQKHMAQEKPANVFEASSGQTAEVPLEQVSEASAEQVAEASMEQAAEAPPEEAPPEQETEKTPSLEEMLRAAERKAQEHYDAWMYAKAECENIRRRAAEEVSKAQKYAVERFSCELLAVKDSLEAGLAVETENVQSFKNGMELTLKQLASVFEKFNIKEINPIGEKLDPYKHQAIGVVESDQEPNTVVSVMQKGYTLYDRVLRPALVMVAKGKD